MNNPTTSTARRAGFRRRAASLAVASLLAAAGAAQAFEIDTGNDDLAMRWDNTFRYNLGVRAQGQDPALLKNPNLDDGDRNFSNGSLVTNRLDVLSEFDSIWQKKYGVRVSAAALVRRGVRQPRQHQHRDRQHAGQRPAGGRAA